MFDCNNGTNFRNSSSHLKSRSPIMCFYFQIWKMCLWLVVCYCVRHCWRHYFGICGCTLAVPMPISFTQLLWLIPLDRYGKSFKVTVLTKIIIVLRLAFFPITLFAVFDSCLLLLVSLHDCTYVFRRYLWHRENVNLLSTKLLSHWLDSWDDKASLIKLLSYLPSDTCNG